MNNLTVWEALIIASQVGFIFATSVIVGVVAGLYLDSVTHRSPLFVILGALLGTASGVAGCVQIVRYLSSRNGRSRD